MGGERGEDERGHGEETCPKSRSGWDMKSVMRSSMLRGSRTNVGKVTLWRSMPTLGREARVRVGRRHAVEQGSEDAP